MIEFVKVCILRKDFHEKVARVLARNLNLSKDCEKTFVKAICKPDKWRRRNPRRRHHCLRADTIIDYVVRARIYYLKGDIVSCLKDLGIALHFIQDAYVPSPRNRTLRRTHGSIEQKASNVSLDYVRREVNEAFRGYQSSYAFVEYTVSQIKQVFNAETAIREAIRTSALITAAVFGPKEPPADLIAKLEIAKERYREKKIKAERVTLTVLITGALLSLTAGFMGNEILFLLLIFSTLILALITYTHISVDPVYYALEREAIWYGLAEK